MSHLGPKGAIHKVKQRLRGNLWPVLQQAAAATLSWWIARLAFDHHLPLFAPIATLVALNTPLGGRGSNTVRVVVGVVVGVLIGQLAFALLGADAMSIGLAVLCALLVALAVDGGRITMAQAAVGAVICVAAGQQAGIDRVLDVLLGGTIALFFSQLLFPAHPLLLLRRAEGAVLNGLSSLLDQTAQRMDRADHAAPRELGEEMRPLFPLLTDLGKARDDTVIASRRTLHWHGRQAPIQQEISSAACLDLLAHSCLTLVRTTHALDADQGRALAPTLQKLADTLHALSAAPGNRNVRGSTARSALNVVGATAQHHSAPSAAARSDVQSMVHDLLIFIGVTDADADRAVNEQAVDVPISPPPRLRPASRRKG